MTQLEIAATSLEDAVNAEQGGAASIEVSVDLAHDGLTPPLDMVQAICTAVQIDIHVMVRPHSRDFVYTPAEVDLILYQTRQFVELGVKGIVFGAQLTPGGPLDLALIGRVVQAAEGLTVTLHRALDTCRNPDAALQALIGIVSRVLTAGPAPSAWQGRETLRRWVKTYGDHFQFVASGGITAVQISDLATDTGVPVCHIGGASRTNGIVDAAKVRQLKAALSA